MSSAHGIAPFAERPPGPFFVTRLTVAPTRAASVSAARVITTCAFGLPLSSTARRAPAGDDNDAASVTASGPGTLSGRKIFAIGSPFRRDRDAAGHAPRRDVERVLARPADDHHLDVLGV